MIKKLKKYILILFLIMLSGGAVLLSGCGEWTEEKLSCYNLSLSYDCESQILTANQQTTYVNNSENAFDKLYFHLYANAFREGNEKLVVSNSKIADAYYQGLSNGYIAVNDVEFDGEDAQFMIAGEKENILIVNLQECLYPDESITIDFSYQVKLANINHRLGVGENTINFGNFYPVACVYEDGVGFSQNLYHSNGDPFYSDCANYNVSLEFDSKFCLASSGEIISQEREEEKTTAKIYANKVRDFSFVLSEKFEVTSDTIDGVEICYYGYNKDSNLQQNMQVAKDSLAFFGEMFGAYPYKKLSIVKSSFLNGGMEYPNLVLISDKIADIDFKYVIVHEIAHQWWYGVVGNDEYNHAWLDEGLAEYSTLLFFKHHTQYGEDFETLLGNAEKSYKTFVKIYTKVNGSVDGVMDKPLCEFETEPEYVECTYTKGVLMMDSICKTIGEKKFVKTLNKYYKEFAYKNARPADFIAKFVEVGGEDMESFINSWLHDRIVLGD